MGVYVPKGKGGWVLSLPLVWTECMFKTETYSARAWKDCNVFIRTIQQWNRYLLFFLKMYFVTRSTLAFTRNMLKCNSVLQYRIVTAVAVVVVIIIVKMACVIFVVSDLVWPIPTRTFPYSWWSIQLTAVFSCYSHLQSFPNNNI